ncbi:uncharacterized protein TNCV_1769781 [Trichonephila clavipes]|nr:uncharacterized protein TNCV_1769781 [Trichonephila clavipes]
MESKTVRQLQDYCRKNKIRGDSKLKKSELIEPIQRHIVFQFDYDLFSKPEKERQLKVKCCDQYYMKQHLQSKNHQEYENVFSFDKSLFGKPKKARPTQIKCNACVKYYKPAYKGHHLRPLMHRQRVDKAPKENKVPVVEPKKSNYETLKNWLLEQVKTFNKTFTNWLFTEKASDTFDPIVEMTLVETSFLSRLQTWVIRNARNFKDPTAFLENCRTMVIEKLSQRVGFKANIQLYCDYQREQETQEFTFKTMNQIILESTDLNEFYIEVVDKLKREMEEFEARGSGWRLIELKYLELRINKYNPLRGSSYIDLPKTIKAKKAAINVKNLDDNKCFMWAILSALHPADDHVDRISKYKPYENELNLEGIEFPVKMEDRVFKRFEKLNNVSVNIYSYESKDIYPLRITVKKADKHINYFT